MPKVSIIIPCYNQGYWLKDAVDSALSQDYPDYNIILINDGSTDPVSNRVFDEIDHSKISKLKTENQGLAEARNTAIRSTNAEYILPLDSDDKISADFLSKTVPILDNDQNVGIVYTRFERFGEQQGLAPDSPYSFPEILINPQIIATALYRRKEWDKAGGYKTDMIYGWEDYDFWLSIIEMGYEVHQIPEVLFFYRQTTGSMAGLDRKKMLYSFNKLFHHHKDLYEKNIGVLFDAVIETKPVRDRINNRETFEIYIPTPTETNAKKEQHYPHEIWSRIHFQVFEINEDQIGKIRIDPGEAIGIYEIASIKLTNTITKDIIYCANTEKSFSEIGLAGSTQRIKDNRLLRFLNTGNDPYFYIPDLNDLPSSQPIEIEVWIKYTSDLSLLQTTSEFVTETNDTLIKIRELEADLKFQKELENQLRYQEISLREEAQNLRNNQTLLNAEIQNQHSVTKAIQAEMYSLQADYKAIAEENKKLKEKNKSLNETVKNLSEQTNSKKNKKKWF